MIYLHFLPYTWNLLNYPLKQNSFLFESFGTEYYNMYKNSHLKNENLIPSIEIDRYNFWWDSLLKFPITTIKLILFYS